jgi:hypothetical protein
LVLLPLWAELDRRRDVEQEYGSSDNCVSYVIRAPALCIAVALKKLIAKIISGCLPTPKKLHSNTNYGKKC